MTKKGEIKVITQGVEHYFFLDSCIFLNELGEVKKLSKSLESGKWSGKIHVAPAVTRELIGLSHGKKKQAKKALVLIEKHKKNSAWSVDCEKGTRILKQLLRDQLLVETAGSNDLSILAESMELAVRNYKIGKTAEVHLITRDNGFKNALRMANRGMPRGYKVELIGTLNWLWKFNWAKYQLEKKLKRLFKKKKNRNKKGDGRCFTGIGNY